MSFTQHGLMRRLLGRSSYGSAVERIWKQSWLKDAVVGMAVANKSTVFFSELTVYLHIEGIAIVNALWIVKKIVGCGCPGDIGSQAMAGEKRENVLSNLRLLTGEIRRRHHVACEGHSGHGI